MSYPYCKLCVKFSKRRGHRKDWMRPAGMARQHYPVFIKHWKRAPIISACGRTIGILVTPHSGELVALK